MKNKILAVSLLLIFILFAGAEANIFSGGKNVSFSPDTTINDDLFISGNSIRFQSAINGDLIGASQELAFSGRCSGNINWASQKIYINGPVDGSVRAFAQDVNINAPIKRNLIAFAQNITVGPAADISRDALLFAQQVTFEGKISRNLKIGADVVIIGGTARGNVDVEAGKLIIKPNTVIEGDLNYKTHNKIKIEDSVVIKGQTNWTKVKEKAEKSKYRAFEPVRFILIMFLVFNFIVSSLTFLLTIVIGNKAVIPVMYLVLIVSGTVVIALSKKITAKTGATLEKRFLTSLGLGLLIILLFPLAVFLSIISIVGLPLGFIIMFGFGIFCFAGSIYALQFVGSFACRLLNIKKPPASVLCLFVGIIISASLVLIPVIGWFIAVIIIAAGLGSLVLSMEKFKKVPQLSKTENPATAKE